MDSQKPEGTKEDSPTNTTNSYDSPNYLPHLHDYNPFSPPNSRSHILYSSQVDSIDPENGGFNENMASDLTQHLMPHAPRALPDPLSPVHPPFYTFANPPPSTTRSLFANEDGLSALYPPLTTTFTGPLPPKPKIKLITEAPSRHIYQLPQPHERPAAGSARIIPSVPSTFIGSSSQQQGPQPIDFDNVIRQIVTLRTLGWTVTEIAEHLRRIGWLGVDELWVENQCCSSNPLLY